MSDGIRHSYIPINVSAGETFEAHIQSNIQHLKIYMEVLWDDN